MARRERKQVVATDHTFGELVTRYRRRAGLTQQKLAAEVGTGARTITNIETGQRENKMGSSIFRKLIEILEIPWEEIPSVFPPSKPGEERVDESEQIWYDKDIPGVGEVRAEYLSQPRRIPILELFECEKWIDFNDLEFPMREATKASVGISTSPHAFYVRVPDDAMQPHLAAGELALIDPTIEPENGNIVLALTPETKTAAIKKFHKDDENRTWLVSTNSDAPPIEVDCATTCKCFKVVESITRKKH